MPVPSLTVGPNTVLTTHGLVVDGQHQPLRHREDFLAVARATGAAVAGILSQLFPVGVAVPGAHGEVIPSKQPAWEHYNQTLLAMLALPPSSAEIPVLGAALLQWCVAAQLVVNANRLAVGQEAEYLAVRFLADEGPAALAYSRDSWQAYLEWLAWSQSAAGLHAQMTGEGERKSARHAPVHVTCPWPEALGADLGGPDNRAQHLGRLASDIILREGGTVFRFGRHTVCVDFGQELLDLFNEAAKDVSPEAPTVQCGFRWAIGDQRLGVRAQRTRVGERTHYVFRLLPMNRPSLLALTL